MSASQAQPAGNTQAETETALVRAPRQAIIDNALLSLRGSDSRINTLELFFNHLTSVNDPTYTKQSIVYLYDQLSQIQETADLVRVRLFDHFLKLFKANPASFDIENFDKFKDLNFPQVESVRRRSNNIVQRNEANYRSLALQFGNDVVNHYVVRVMTANKPLTALARLGRTSKFDTFNQLLVAVNRATLQRLVSNAWDKNAFISTADINKVIEDENPVTAYTEADYNIMQRRQLSLLGDGAMVPHADTVKYGLHPVQGYGAQGTIEPPRTRGRPTTPPATSTQVSVGITPQAQRFADFDIDSDHDDESEPSSPERQDPLAGTAAGVRRDANRERRRANRCTCPRTRRRYIKRQFRRIGELDQANPQWVRAAGKITKYFAQGNKLCTNHMTKYAAMTHALVMSSLGGVEPSDIEEDAVEE